MENDLTKGRDASRYSRKPRRPIQETNARLLAIVVATIIMHWRYVNGVKSSVLSRLGHTILCRTTSLCHRKRLNSLHSTNEARCKQLLNICASSLFLHTDESSILEDTTISQVATLSCLLCKFLDKLFRPLPLQWMATFRLLLLHKTNVQYGSAT